MWCGLTDLPQDRIVLDIAYGISCFVFIESHKSAWWKFVFLKIQKTSAVEYQIKIICVASQGCVS